MKPISLSVAAVLLALGGLTACGSSGPSTSPDGKKAPDYAGATKQIAAAYPDGDWTAAKTKSGTDAVCSDLGSMDYANAVDQRTQMAVKAGGNKAAAEQLADVLVSTAIKYVCPKYTDKLPK